MGQQPQPASSGSLLSTSPSTASTEVAQPPISPLLLGAGRLLLQNWQPILQVIKVSQTIITALITSLSSKKAGKALASAGGALGGAGAVATATGAARAGLVTAGVAK